MGEWQSWWGKEPVEQILHPERVEAMALGYEQLLTSLFEIAETSPSSIKGILELGPGAGAMTLALLRACPIAKIVCIDYNDSLLPKIRGDNRVTFIQGLFASVLQDAQTFTQYGNLDLAMFCSLSRSHGLKGWTLTTIHKIITRDGLAMTIGDNTGLLAEQMWKRYWKEIGCAGIDSVVWRKI